MYLYAVKPVWYMYGPMYAARFIRTPYTKKYCPAAPPPPFWVMALRRHCLGIGFKQAGAGDGRAL